MKKITTYIARLLLPFLLTLTLSSCWSGIELNRIAIVTGIAVDTAKDGQTAVRLQIGQMENKSSDAGSPQASNKSDLTILCGEGNNLFSAIRNFSKESSRRVFLEHNQIIIFSQSEAKKGLRQHLDFFTRDPESRMGTSVLVSEGEAKEILVTQPKQESVAPEEILRILKNQERIAVSKQVDLLEFLKKHQSESTCAVLPMIHLREDPGSKNEDEKSIVVSGLAVFHEDRMIGELTERETRGFLWSIGQLMTTALYTKTPKGEATLDITRAEGKMQISRGEDGGFQAKISIKQYAGVALLDGYNGMRMEEIIPILEEASAQVILEDVGNCLSKAKELQADIFGFGEKINRQYHKDWVNMKDKWREVFATMKIEVEVESNVVFTGRLSKIEK